MTTASQTGTATILFTDLVESTAQRGQLGEEAAEALRRSYDRLLAEAVSAHHGTVTKSVGDGIMATFTSAADAVGAAVSIQQAVDNHNRRAGTSPLAMRVGISLGDVAWENGDCFGTPVIEASRLCEAAEGGQILIAEIVRLSARGRGGHTFTPVGAVALKGLPEPVAASAVSWERRVHGALPLPPRLGTRPAFAMFGRSDEADALASAWTKAKDGQRQLVLLAGEPGIGKTRLATEAARVAYDEGDTVLFGGCDEDVGLPYRPFVEAVRHYVAHAPDSVLAAHVQAHHGELARIVPELSRRVPDLPPPQVAEAETERFLLFEAVTGLLAAASQDRPVVLILDDLQWAGMPELLLLKHIVRSAEPMRLLVIATYRDTDRQFDVALLAKIAETSEDAVLDALDEATAAALVSEVRGAEQFTFRHLNDPAAAAVLYERLRPVAGQVYVAAGIVTCGGSYGLYAGMLAACLHRWDDAERHLTDALAMNERLGARPYVVRARRAWASMLLDRDDPSRTGDATRARDLIAAGRAEAETLGMARELVRFQRLQARLAPDAP